MNSLVHVRAHVTEIIRLYIQFEGGGDDVDLMLFMILCFIYWCESLAHTFGLGHRVHS